MTACVEPTPAEPTRAEPTLVGPTLERVRAAQVEVADLLTGRDETTGSLRQAGADLLAQAEGAPGRPGRGGPGRHSLAAELVAAARAAGSWCLPRPGPGSPGDPVGSGRPPGRSGSRRARRRGDPGRR